ncbi:ABC transporter permease [Pseudonocardia sp.]|uniref:ABC transporter permease n=1 Tax=Pseudonocardia sp. TaxID=60912 RepID=UPI002604F0D7|nr:ABC transporter permease [Pseudonocardia sp.]
MARFVARRLLLAIPVIIGASFIVFLLVYALPGDPIRALAGDRPLPPGVEAELRDRFNLDDNVLVQYLKYMGNLLRGDLGIDFSGREVSETIALRLPVTARLAVAALVIEAVIGLVAGILAGIRRNGYLDNLVLVSTTLLVSIPVFVFGYVAQYFLGVQLGWFPISSVNDGWVSYVLPGFVLASASMAYVARLTRTSLAENMQTDFVRTARAKGLPERTVVGKHALRNSLIPVVTFLGADFGALMSGAIVTEGIFNIPGLGRAVFDAVKSQEGSVVVGITTFFIFVYIFFNLLVDVLYAALDPRIRLD